MEQVQDQQAKRLERAKRLIRSMADRTTDRGFTEAEAMESAAQMGALLAQFDLELDEVLARDTSDMVWQEVYAADYSAAQVITGIGRFCSLIVYSMSGGTVAAYKMYGHKPDIELGTYLYEICAEAAEQGWTDYMQAHGYSKRARDSFRIGFASRIADRLTQMKRERDEENDRRAAAAGNTGTSLVVLKDQIVQAEFDKVGPKLRTVAGPRVHNTGAYHKGAAHGSSVNLGRPLTGGGSQPRLS